MSSRRGRAIDKRVARDAPAAKPAPEEAAHQKMREVPSPLSVWPAGDKGVVPGIGEIGLNQFAPYLLNRISAQWNDELQDVLKRSGMTTSQMRALAVLTVASGITVNELALFAVTEQSTMSRTLDALEDEGLIRRKTKTGDMRVREVFITEKGLSLFSSVWPDIYSLYAGFFEGVQEMEFRGFISTLHKVLRNAQSRTL